MSLTSIVLLAVIVLLAFIAVKFLAGLIRTVVTAALFTLAAGIVLSLLTGQDLIGPTVAVIANTLNQSAP